MAKKTRKVGRSSVTGKFASREEVQCNPNETVMDTVPLPNAECGGSAKLKELIDELILISETDDIWTLWMCKVKKPRVISPNTFLELVGGTFCTDIEFDKFFDHVIRSQGVSQGKEIGQRYQDFRNGAYDILDPRYVFKVGVSPHRYAYYVVGISDGQFIGAKAESVET